MNLWHTHDDGFRGTHVHGIDGSAVEHVHSGEDLEVVEVFGKRYKKPKPMPIVDPDIDVVELTVDDVVVVTGLDQPA